MGALPEAALYAPVKAHLERLGYTVKGEVKDCDLVARRGDEPPVIVELKTRLSLELLIQAVDRQRLSDAVYVAVPATVRRSSLWKRQRRGLKRLCLKLGVGVMLVASESTGDGKSDDHTLAGIEVLWDPAPYRPRRDTGRVGRLLKEFEERLGDPDVGGTPARRRMTAYRQQVVRLARHLQAHGPTPVAELRAATGIATAAAMLQRDYYRWFERTARGVYGLSPRGESELAAGDDPQLPGR